MQVAVAIMKFACFFIRGVLVCLAFLWICAAGAKVKIAGALRERIGESFSDNFPAFRWSLGFAKQSGASLLLWPEFALAFPAKGVSRKSVFPFCDGNVPQVGWTCGSEGVQGNASSIAKAVGCAARDAGIGAAVNICETFPCQKGGKEECPPDGKFVYNSELVFDSRGTLVAKYYKSHPWYAKVFDAPRNASANLVYFDMPTTQGMERVGVFTCKDIMYSQPGDNLVAVSGVHRVIYSVAVDVLGIIGESALEVVERRWAKNHNVTMLTSNLGVDAGTELFLPDGEKAIALADAQIPGETGRVRVFEW